MPRRRTTRATTSKRPIPTLPEDTKENNLDEEQRRRKVEILLLDFKAEMSSRIRDLEHGFTSLLSQIDLAYSMEIMQIPMEVRSMKLTDYLKNGGVFQKSAISNSLSSEIQAILGSHLEPVEEEDGNSMIPPKTVRQQRMKKADVPGSVQQTTRRTGRNRKAVCETPANSMTRMLCTETPLITPKFDPRLYHTPAVVMRAPKPGEVIMSIEGSPISSGGVSIQNGGLLVPIDDSRSVWLSDNCDLSSVDPGTIKKAYQTIDEVKARLEAALKLKPTKK